MLQSFNFQSKLWTKGERSRGREWVENYTNMSVGGDKQNIAQRMPFQKKKKKAEWARMSDFKSPILTILCCFEIEFMISYTARSKKKKNMLVNKKFKKKYDWAMATHIDTHAPKVSGAIRLQSRNKFERKTRNNNTQQK